jgi:putative Flp pilus-assembly TadE/G-like protein
MKRMRDESGQAMILVALSLVVILGFVGFATDVGVLLHDKRNLQIAADAAAIAGAKRIRINTAQVTPAEYAASAQNGYTNGVNGVTVVPSYPAADGPHAGDPAYAEAIVRQTQRTFFMRLFGFTSMPVSARAVAFNGATTDTACLTALNSNAPDTIHLQGSFTVNAPGCSVIDNSNNPNALEFTGGAGRITSGGIGVVGGMTGPYSTDSTPVPVSGIQQISDPLAGVVTPPTYNPASCTAAPAAAKKNGPVTWGTTAGATTCYSGTIKVDSAVTMTAGVYVIPGTLDFSGKGSIDGTAGVTFYIPPGGTFGNNGAGNTTLTLTAPTSGPYNGVVIYQNAANTNDIYLNGTPVVGLTGVIYAPSAQLDLGGNTKVGVKQTYITDFVVGKLYDFGNAELDIQNYTSIVPGSPLTTIALVE